jgi:hypothetical protein
MRLAPRLAVFALAGTAAYLGLAVLGEGGFRAFFAHGALVAVAAVLCMLAGVSLVSRGNLSPGIREDRGNRWVILIPGVY